jgi:glycosyltransferase involved in cell wall biosynthesis
MLKIVFIGPLSEQGGAVSLYDQYLIHALLEAGASVDVVSDSSVSVPPLDVSLVGKWSKGVMSIPRILFAVCRCTHPDVIHVQHETFLFGGPLTALLFPIMVMILRLRGVPVVVTMHGVTSLRKMDKQFVRAIGWNFPATIARVTLKGVTQLICRASSVVTLHEVPLSETLQREYGVSARKIVVVPHGVPIVSPCSDLGIAKSKLGLPHDSSVILFFGYLTRRKGIEVLIDSFIELSAARPTCHLVVVGGVPPTAPDVHAANLYAFSLRERVPTELDGRVHFTGFVSQDELNTYFCSASVLVLPYLYDIASSGSLAMAAAYGVPVIGSDLPTLRSILREDEYLFTPGAVSELVSRLDRLLSSKESIERARALLTEVRDDRSWKAVSTRLLELYESVLGRPKIGQPVGKGRQ